MDNRNKRIAKNTVYLYFRTILIMLVSLYTSRVVLDTLGVEDFGIYNAVGGFVAMFAVLSGTMANAISRYITFAIGKGDQILISKVFCTSLNIQFLISVVILLLCELFGLWFLNYRMNIPEDRIIAANWVLHCSLLAFVINLISVPYNACIIAYERMNAFAYISILDAILRLSVALLIVYSPFDKLIIYSLLLVLASLLVRLLYAWYCRTRLKNTKYSFIYDKTIFKEMLGFAGWNFLTNGASILNSQGVTLLVNTYFGVLLNSARGIAIQVDSAVNQFVMSFSTAINPQITKSYAQEEMNRMFFLICKGAKYSYFLLLFFAVPIILEAHTILKLWLKNVPEMTELFIQLSIVGAMVTILGNTGYIACMATGRIKRYCIWITIVGSFVFILSWVAYALGAPVETTYLIYILVYIIVQVVRLIIMKDGFNFPIMMYVKEVIGRIIIPTILSFAVPLMVVCFIQPSILRLLLTCVVSVISTCIFVFVLGLSSPERSLMIEKSKLFYSKVRR